jgi:hypothetical protein
VTIEELVAKGLRMSRRSTTYRLAVALKVAIAGLRCETYTTPKGCRRRKARDGWCDPCIALDGIDRIAEGGA